jgi:predicted TIM-barrel fold metal-dependent hydrolase
VAYFFASPDHIGLEEEEAAVRAENDWTAQQVGQYPDRLVGFCGVNPLREYSIREIERCSRLPGMIGVKLHFANSSVTLSDPEHAERVRRLFAAANRLRLPIAAHVEEIRLQEYGRAQAEILLNQIFPAAPDVIIQIMHMAGSGPGYLRDPAFEVFAAAREAADPRMRKVYVDVASNVVAATPPESLELVARRLRQFGLSHVLFGSDRLPGVANEEPKTAWQSFLRLPLTPDEFTTVAQNEAPYFRR